MEKYQFKKSIEAPREKVWNILWGKETYPVWTAPFAEGSNVITDWKEGSKVLFVDGKGDGMVSKLVESRPNEFMSFQHLGMVKDGQEDTTSDKVKSWAGATENYTLATVNGNTELTIDIDLTEDMKEYFEKTWPLALDKLKELSEQH